MRVILLIFIYFLNYKIIFLKILFARHKINHITPKKKKKKLAISKFISSFKFCIMFVIIFILGIKTALKQENLNPEIEEKLLELQRYQEKQMKQESNVPVNVSRVTSNSNIPNTIATNRVPRKRPVSGSKDEDTDWVLDNTPKRQRPARSVIELKKGESMYVQFNFRSPYKLLL